jgi:hypothetical protein
LQTLLKARLQAAHLPGKRLHLLLNRGQALPFFFCCCCRARLGFLRQGRAGRGAVGRMGLPLAPEPVPEAAGSRKR